MGRDGLQIGVQIRTFVAIAIRMFYRSVCSHPFVVGILLFILFLYRSSPFLFSLLLSSSPVLVCTAVLLGTLLSFGEPKFPMIEEDEKGSAEVAELKMGSVEDTICFEEDESIDRDSGYTELRREIVEGTIDAQPLLVRTDRVDRFENDGVARSLMPIEQNTREIQIRKQPINEVNSESENLETEQKASLDDQKIQLQVDAGLSHDGILQIGSSGKSQAENFEDYKSAEESVDALVMDQLDSSAGSWERSGNILEDSLSPFQKVDASSSHDEILENSAFMKVQAQNFQDYKSAEGSSDAQMRDGLDTLRSWEQLEDVLEDSLSPVRKVQAAVLAQLRNQLESSLGSWNLLDGGVWSSAAQKVQAESSEDYKSAEGSVDVQITDQLGSSLETWKQCSSAHDNNGDDVDDEEEEEESDSGSDGAESSSPDASMADIIPMLDELYPLLEDENPQTSNLSRQSSATTMSRVRKSCHSSIHSDDESDQKEEEVGDIKSDAEDEDDEEETQGSKDDPEKSAITWTEDDQKNLMDLGSSELERNQRLESLIARRRARRMMAERNLIDLDGMDLQFHVAPISTTRRNPFDLPHDSYDDLGLPPIPGSAPSVLLPRRNPFDLPYDSSEEKPDLMADSFQQEFMELCQGEASNQTEAVFRRNETFNVGSSVFTFGRYHTTRASRFRPYFVPERTDSDVMSYSSSLQRQSSELSEFKASSAAETESTSVDGDEEEKKSGEHESAQEMEPSSEIDQASLLVELGSQSSDDLHSLSEKEKDFVPYVPEIELGGVGNSPGGVSGTFETQLSAEIGLGDRENDHESESWLLDREISVDVVRELIEEKHSTRSSLSSSPKDYNDVKVKDVNGALVNREQSQVDNVDMLVRHSLEMSVSDVPSDHSPETSDFSHGTEVRDDNPKESVYDSSPQAVKRNIVSSSTSLDMHMERSEIRLCQMPSVQREFLITEEPNVCEEDAEQSVQDEKQVVDDHDITMKQNEEVGHDISDQSRFLEGPINVEASVAAEYELRLSAESLDTGLVKSSDDKVSENERTQVLNQEDDAGVYTEGKLDTIESEDDKASAFCDRSSEDLTLTSDKRDTSISRYSVQSEMSALTAEIREESRMDKEVEQQFLASSSNVLDDDNDIIEKLASALDESHHFSHESSIEDPSDNPAEKKSSVVHSEVNEMAQENNVDRHLNIVLVEENKKNILLDPLPSDQPSSWSEEFESEAVKELAEMEPVNNNISQELSVSGGSGGNEKIVYDFTGDTKEMNEELLSELDAVGDFRVKDKGSIMDMSMTYSNAGLDSTMSERLQDERHSHTSMSFVNDISLEANADVQHFETLTEARELNAAACEEINLNSCAADASTGLLLLEAQSIVDIDAAFKSMCKWDVQKPISGESIGPDLERELPDAGCPETELEVEDIEAGTYTTELISPQVNAAVNHREPDETVASDLTSVERHIPDSKYVDSGFSVLEAELLEKDGEDFEKTVETEIDLFNIGEAPQRAPEAETGVDSVEPVPLEINRDDNEVLELPVVRSSIAPAIACGAQIETFSFMESESLETDRVIKEMQDLLPADRSFAPSTDSEDPMERVSSVESRSFVIERVASVESPVVEATRVTSVDNEDEVGRYGFLESPTVEASSVTSLDNEGKIGRVHSVGFPVVGATSITSIDNEGEIEMLDPVELPAVELRANIIPSMGSEERIGVVVVESGSSLIDTDIKETKEPPADEEVIACAFASEAQLDKLGSVEAQSLSLDGNTKENQESLVVGEILHSPESEDQTESLDLTESESVHTGRDWKGVQELHDDKTSGPSVEVERDGNLEVESLPIDKDREAIQESPIVEANIASKTFEHESQTAGSVECELLQIEADIKGIQESPVVEAGTASAIESEYQTKGPSLMDIAESQVPQDHQLTSLQRSDGPISRADDSATGTGGATGEEFGGTETHSSQAEEVETHESHLVPSSSSSLSSSSSSSDSSED